MFLSTFADECLAGQSRAGQALIGKGTAKNAFQLREDCQTTIVSTALGVDRCGDIELLASNGAVEPGRRRPGSSESATAQKDRRTGGRARETAAKTRPTHCRGARDSPCRGGPSSICHCTCPRGRA